ncbi:MAG: DUF937 domain-containing protein [Micrococcales bacterium]|nr:DUF937 domain-containing protein [Micrococcales bacterium]
MAAFDEILSALPVDQLAQQLGADTGEVEQAARLSLPAILGGLNANAQDPNGAQSILEALTQHSGGLLDGGVDLGQIDVQDGEKIASHIFGSNEDQVAAQLGGLGGGQTGALVKKLIPILAPLVLAWLSKQVGGAAGGSGGQASLPQPTDAAAAPGGSAGGSILTDILGSVLGGASQQQAPTQQGSVNTGQIITDVLGGLLGGGRR